MLLLSLSSCSYMLSPLPWSQAESQRERAKAGQGEPASFASRLQARQAEAEALMAQSDLAAALTQWEILHALDPENTTFSQQRQATQATIEQRVQSHLQVDQKALKQGHVKPAKQAFLRVLALDPSQSLAHTYLRQIEERHLKRLQHNKLARTQKRAAEASAAYGRAEQGGRAHLERGLQHFREKAFEASIVALRAHLADHPQSPKAKQVLAEAHFQLGRRLHRQGKLADALSHYQTAREMYTDQVNASQIDQYIHQVQRALAP